MHQQQLGTIRDHAEVELQRLRRQLEDSQWDLRTLKRRMEERKNQLRDVRSEADSAMKRARVAERDLGAAQSELAIAAAEVGAERRRTSALRAELQSVRERVASAAATAATAKSSAEEQRLRLEAAEERRLRLEADGRDRVSAAAAAEARAEGRAATLLASLRAVTAERDELLAAEAAARRSVDPAAAEHGATHTRELESMRCALAAQDVELESIVDATAEFGHHTESVGGDGVGSAGGSSGFALRGALAAAAEARRTGRLVAELQEECSSLTAKVMEERADSSRLRAALEQAKLAEQKAAAGADAVNVAAASATAGQSSSNPPQKNDVDGSKKGGYSAAEAQAVDIRAQEAEDALQKALAGAQQAWGVVSSCLVDESKMGDNDLLGATTTTSTTAAAALSTLPPTMASPLFKQQSASLVDPSLANLVSGVQVLSTAHRNRGNAIRRATVNARAKTICAREARRREEAERRAREDAEARLEEALVALDDCRRHHYEQDHHHNQQRQQLAQWGIISADGWVAGVADRGEGIPRGGDGSRSLLSHDQEEHLRQIRSEVDRLEGQNRTLRRSLEGAEGGSQLLGKTTEIRSRGRERIGGGDVPTQRLLFPSATGGNGTKYGRKRSDSQDCWECADGLSGSSGRVRTPSPSPDRSWTAVSNVHGGGAWPPRGGIGGDGSNGEQGLGRGGGGSSEEEDDDVGDARARVLEECAGYCAPPQDDGSGRTLVPSWSRDT